MGTYAPVICVSRLICRAGNERKLLTDFACVRVCEHVYNLPPCVDLRCQVFLFSNLEAESIAPIKASKSERFLRPFSGHWRHDTLATTISFFPSPFFRLLWLSAFVGRDNQPIILR